MRNGTYNHYFLFHYLFFKLYDFCRNSYNDGIVWNIMYNNSICSYNHIISDYNWS